MKRRFSGILKLYNPFAPALAYDREAECRPYMLFMGK